MPAADRRASHPARRWTHLVVRRVTLSCQSRAHVRLRVWAIGPHGAGGRAGQSGGGYAALEEQRNGEWRYLEFLQVTSWITADIFMREIPGGTRARHRSRPVD